MIKRYFIVVLLLSLLPAGVSAQRRAAAKKDWKTKYDYVGAVHNGRILVHRGGEGSNPRMGRFYTDGCFGYTDTCGTVVIPLIYDYADSFSKWVCRGRQRGKERSSFRAYRSSGV